MRLFIIGRLFKRGRVVAYKLYDATNKEQGIYPKKVVNRYVEQGNQVVGLHRDKDGNVGGTYNSFNINKTDSLNGKGLPIKPSGRYILLGLSGFLEETKYRLVNSSGDEKIVRQDEFEKLVDAGRINGAIRSTKIKGKIVINKQCNYREYNY